MSKRSFESSIGLATFLAVATIAVADGGGNSSPAILADETIAKANYLPDFSYAGYANGALNVPDAPGIVVKVDDFGA